MLQNQNLFLIAIHIFNASARQQCKNLDAKLNDLKTGDNNLKIIYISGPKSTSQTAIVNMAVGGIPSIAILFPGIR